MGETWPWGVPNHIAEDVDAYLLSQFGSWSKSSLFVFPTNISNPQKFKSWPLAESAYLSCVLDLPLNLICSFARTILYWKNSSSQQLIC